MDVANTVDADVFALAILVLVFVNSKRQADRAFMQRRLFMSILGALSVLLIADAAGRIVNGMPGETAYCLNWATTLLLYVFIPFMPSLYFMYAYYQTYYGEKRLKKLLWPFVIYIALDAALNVSSLFTGWTFTIDAANLYHRGPYLLAHTLSCYALLLFTALFVYRNRKKVDPRYLSPLLLYGLIPAAAGALQGFTPGLSLTLPSMSISVLLIYLNIQDRRLDTDYLTGAYSRRLLDNFMREKTQSGLTKKAFSAILIDLDNFKAINDTLGHKAGDDALTDAVGLLKGCLRRGDFISRYGGDEFLIILDIANNEVLEETVKRLKEVFRQFNEKNSRPYTLGFSSGYGVYDMSSGMDPDQFIRYVDGLMYEDKSRAAMRHRGGEKDA